jgi:hypothetical protein
MQVCAASLISSLCHNMAFLPVLVLLTIEASHWVMRYVSDRSNNPIEMAAID